MKTIIIPVFILFALFTIKAKAQSYSDITYNTGTSIEVQTGADICADAIIINGVYSGGGTICLGALPVTLSSFTFSVVKNNVRLSWVTEVELNNSGFDIERAKVTQKGAEAWSKIASIQGNGTTNEPKSYSFEDKKLQTAAYRYRLKQIDFNGGYEYFDLMQDVIVGVPGSFSMGQNYPNPSNPRSKIDYEIPINGKVTIKLYNSLGQEVVNIVNETKEAGYYSAEFDGTGFASGVYFYRIIIEGSTQQFSKTRKMILVK